MDLWAAIGHKIYGLGRNAEVRSFDGALGKL